MAGGEKVEVRISREAYEKARKFVEETGGFSSVEEFIEFLIEEAVAGAEGGGMTREDEERVKRHLSDLGYL